MRNVYGRAVAYGLGEIGVWTPGLAVKLGDFGEISENCFKRMGNVFDLLGRDISEFGTRPSTSDKVCIKSEGALTADLAADADGIAGVSIQFGKNHGAVICIDNIAIEEIQDIAKLGRAAGASDKWNRGHHVVVRVRKAGVYSVILTSVAGGGLELRADPTLLKSFQVGEASAAAKIKVNGAASASADGKDGVISVELRRLKWFSKDQLSGPVDGKTVEDKTAEEMTKLVKSTLEDETPQS